NLVGKSILQKNFDLAIEVLLSFTSEYDLPENNKIRGMLKDKSNHTRVLNEIPPQMDVEILVLREFIDRGDSLKALRVIPLPLRRFFVEAFQSFIFNLTVSMVYDNNNE